MVSRVFEICNAYESGYGHGLKRDGLDLSKTPHADAEVGEAYQIGYEAGAERSTGTLPASWHSAADCTAAFEWLRSEATKDTAPPHAGVALDEWHALATGQSLNDKAQGGEPAGEASPGATGSAAGDSEKG